MSAKKEAMHYLIIVLILIDNDNDPILYYAKRFVPELEFKAIKYNL